MVLSQSAPLFEDHAVRVVRGLRGSFSDALLLVGADPSDARSISKHLGLNKNLAWKVSKIVQAEDPFVVLQQMPGGPGLRIFLRANERAGIGEKQMDALRSAIDEYDRFIALHSGDRATMEIMGSTLSVSDKRQIAEQHRKQLFQGLSSVWGVQTRVMLKISIVGISDRGTFSMAILNALIDFRRLRPDVSWPLAIRHLTNDDGSQMHGIRSEAIDSAFAGDDDAPLIGEFCSKPIPKLIVHKSGTQRCYELAKGPVGNTGAMNCVFGTLVTTGVPIRGEAANEQFLQSACCDTPTELLITDVYIHTGIKLGYPLKPECESRLNAYPSTLNPPAPILPVYERIEDLGAGGASVPTPEVREYNRMLTVAFERAGWDRGEFRGHRLRVAYPPVPSWVRMKCPMRADA